MITRVSTTTEGYDPPRKGRRVVVIDELHQELIGGTIEYAPNTRSDGSYNYTEIVGGELVDDFKDAIRRFFCRVTGWCDGSRPASTRPALPPAKERIVRMLPEDDGESPGATVAPEFDEIPGSSATAGMPASSAPEDYAAPTGVLPPKPPPLPAASIPIMKSVLSRVQSGDPTALKSLSTLATSAQTNPVSAQALKNLATLAKTSGLIAVNPVTLAPMSGVLNAPVVSSIPLAPAPFRPTLIRKTLVSGEAGSVTHAIGQIFSLVLSPLAWTLDGTGRLTAVAGKKLEVLSRML